MSEFNPSDGLLLICQRDDAKRLFVAKSDEALAEFFDEFLSDSNHLNQDDVLDLKSIWRAVHACFCHGSADSDAGELPLNQVILGGRKLGSGSQFQVAFVRPDLVPHIVTALDGFTMETAEKSFQVFQSANSQRPTVFDTVWSLIGDIGNLFRRAAELKAAVVFYQRED